ncbi:MAG: hypothetical protein AB1631_10985 [Acidobacteriota bacterium]
MNRRHFIGALSVGAVAAKFIGTGLSFGNSSPQIAITFDDFNLFDTPILSAEQRNRAILEALRARDLKSVMFVAGRYIG